MTDNEETVSTLPFFFLSDGDLNFSHFVGNWSVPNLNETVDLFDLFPNPDQINVMNLTQISCLLLLVRDIIRLMS